MQWSPQQEKAFKEIRRFLQGDLGQVFYLFGYAGTGKTTLAKEIANMTVGNVLFAAYTGKAAHVLRTKGCPEASTIHSLIYRAKDKGTSYLLELENKYIELKKGKTEDEIRHNPQIKKLYEEILRERALVDEPYFVLNTESIVPEAELVIIDECSMVDDRMGQDLLSFGTRVLVLGDPAQLPPVSSTGYFTNGITPHVMLDEIHRQALESPIIRLSMLARNAQPIPLGSYGESKVIRIDKVQTEDALLSDQLIVGRNVTRNSYNHRMRTLVFGSQMSWHPTKNDKIICLKNDHDMGLLNGAMFKIEEQHGIMDDKIVMRIKGIDEPEKLVEVCAHAQYFRGETPLWQDMPDAKQFDYGYAITCHKAQGSQWNNVYLTDESYCFRNDRSKWLYTAITRAAEKLTLVRS